MEASKQANYKNTCSQESKKAISKIGKSSKQRARRTANILVDYLLFGKINL